MSEETTAQPENGRPFTEEELVELARQTGGDVGAALAQRLVALEHRVAALEGGTVKLPEQPSA